MAKLGGTAGNIISSFLRTGFFVFYYKTREDITDERTVGTIREGLHATD